MFFILFEAMHSEKGERLGILGSTILAEIFFAAYKRTRPIIEEDPSVQTGLGLVFGEDVPQDMPSLIRFITDNGGLKPVTCT